MEVATYQKSNQNSSKPKPCLSGRGITKVFGVGKTQTVAVDHVDFDFNEGEINYIRTKGKSAAQTMAGIYAAKEAFSKALGTGITFDLKEISIFHDEAGMPAYSLSGKAEKLGEGDRFWLSITHDGGIAAAVCVREDSH